MTGSRHGKTYNHQCGRCQSTAAYTAATRAGAAAPSGYFEMKKTRAPAAAREVLRKRIAWARNGSPSGKDAVPRSRHGVPIVAKNATASRLAGAAALSMRGRIGVRAESVHCSDTGSEEGRDGFIGIS